MTGWLATSQIRFTTGGVMAEWATSDVRAAAIYGPTRDGLQYPEKEVRERLRADGFDRWLAAHDAEVAAKAHMEALEEAASIAEGLEFGPAPAFSQPAAHKWGALKAAERIRARAAELTRDTPSR